MAKDLTAVAANRPRRGSKPMMINDHIHAALAHERSGALLAGAEQDSRRGGLLQPATAQVPW